MLRINFKKRFIKKEKYQETNLIKKVNISS